MTRAPRLLLALVIALGGLVALAGPASAATPTLTVSTGPYDPDQSVLLAGTGCPASSPVSIDIWNTARPSSHITLDHATNAAPAGPGAGNFLYVFDLDNRLDPGAEVSFFFSCTATVDWGAGPALAAAPKYDWIKLANPHVAIDAPAQAPYGAATQVVVRNDVVHGATTLDVDGTPVPFTTPGSYDGWTVFDLPTTLGVGAHHLHATWDPSAPDAPTVTADQALQVTKIRPSVTLTAARRSITRRKPLRLRVTVQATTSWPRTGLIVIKDGRRTMKQLVLRAGDAGTRVIRIRLARVGKHRLRAVYAGNAVLAGARSAAIVLRVPR